MDTITSPSAQRVVLRDVSWDLYERILAENQSNSAPRFTFDRGTLEIMSPGSNHERSNRSLARLVWAVAVELGIDIEDVGSMTYKRASAQQGFEPDSSFYVRRPGLLDSDAEIDPEVDPPPDLIIEIDVSRSSLAKMELFASLNVPEVWVWYGERVGFFVLYDGAYVSTNKSRLIPVLTPEIVTSFMQSRTSMTGAAWQRSILDWARSLN